MHTSFRLAAACTLWVAVLTVSACTAAPPHVDGPAAALARTSAAPVAPAPPPAGTRAFIARLPLGFEPNVGQADAGIRYLSRAPGMRLELTEHGARLVTTRANGQERVVGLRLVGGDPAAVVAAEEELPGKVHYFTASDASGWRTDIPTYRRVVYRNVYAARIWSSTGRKVRSSSTSSSRAQMRGRSDSSSPVPTPSRWRAATSSSGWVTTASGSTSRSSISTPHRVVRRWSAACVLTAVVSRSMSASTTAHGRS